MELVGAVLPGSVAPGPPSTTSLPLPPMTMSGVRGGGEVRWVGGWARTVVEPTSKKVVAATPGESVVAVPAAQVIVAGAALEPVVAASRRVRRCRPGREGCCPQSSASIASPKAEPITPSMLESVSPAAWPPVRRSRRSTRTPASELHSSQSRTRRCRTAGRRRRRPRARRCRQSRQACRCRRARRSRRRGWCRLSWLPASVDTVDDRHRMISPIADVRDRHRIEVEPAPRDERGGPAITWFPALQLCVVSSCRAAPRPTRLELGFRKKSPPFGVYQRVDTNTDSARRSDCAGVGLDGRCRRPFGRSGAGPRR